MKNEAEEGLNTSCRPLSRAGSQTPLQYEDRQILRPLLNVVPYRIRMASVDSHDVVNDR